MNIVERIDANAKEHDALLKEVIRSDLWGAIKNFINDAPVKQCGIVDKRGYLYSQRGQGPFSLRKVHAYPPGACEEPPNTVRLCFSMCLYDEENDDYVTDVDCIVDAPADLLVQFDQLRFDEWVNSKNAELRAVKLDRAREELEKLRKDFPELF